MFGAYVKENRKALIALAVYTVVFALVFWLYRLPLGAAGYAALVCLFLLALWFAVDYRRFAARLRLLQRLEQEITLSTEQLPEPDGMLEAQYQALVRALDAGAGREIDPCVRCFMGGAFCLEEADAKSPVAHRNDPVGGGTGNPVLGRMRDHRPFFVAQCSTNSPRRANMWSMGPEPLPRSSMADRQPEIYALARSTAASRG